MERERTRRSSDRKVRKSTSSARQLNLPLRKITNNIDQVHTVCACLRVCVRAPAHAFVRACVCPHVFLHLNLHLDHVSNTPPYHTHYAPFSSGPHTYECWAHTYGCGVYGDAFLRLIPFRRKRPRFGMRMRSRSFGTTTTHSIENIFFTHLEEHDARTHSI